MKQVSLKILENAPLSQCIYRLRLGGDVSAVTAPGQFSAAPSPCATGRRAS